MKLIANLPKSIAIAVSGGVDSMVALHHLRKRHDVIVLHYYHDSQYSSKEYEFVNDYCQEHGINIITERQETGKPKALSQEEYWRHGRYKFFKRIAMPVVTAHTLDDAVEWYIFSAAHGMGKFMEYSHDNVVRPYLGITKTEIVQYAASEGVPYLSDPSNNDVTFAARNRIRHNIVPEMLKINPGLHTVVKKRIIAKLTEQRKLS